MSKLYSKTTGGFYDSSIHGTMPDDAVAVTDEAYAALFAAQAEGKIIQADADGNPEAITFVPSPTQVRAVLISAAQVRLDINDKVAMRCLKAGVVYPPDWLVFDIALRAIVNGTDTTSTILPTTPAYPTGS